MLQKLIIKNIALIDSAEISFSKGLNVLSGETGAGKSVIIESLNFVLGAKADKTLIRSGKDECSVIAEFDVANNEVIKTVYAELDFDCEEILIVSRKFTIDGKSSIKINGNSATVSMLRKFTSVLVDVHGQSEHFNLLKTSNQLLLLDKFGGEELSLLKQQLLTQYKEYRELLSKLEDLGGDENQRLIKIDVLNYQINEISNANLQEDEEENLMAIKQKLNNQEKILTALRCVVDGIGCEDGIEDVLANITKSISNISSFDNDYAELYNNLESVFSQITDIQSNATDLIDNFEVSEYNPYEIDERLDLIKRLKSKYGSTISDIHNFLENAVLEKSRLENFAEKRILLEKEKSILQKKIFENYNKLSSIRKSVAHNLQNNVLNELKELGMSKANFVVTFLDKPTFDNCKFDSSNGFDEIEFKFSANLGEPLKPLSMVISGGEMSRFMLAIKAQTAKYNEISTFIFDEIDVGISGNIAKVVAEKFAKISLSTQIIAITHLPQISAMADNNLLIEKKEINEKTITSVRQLNYDDKVYEILRLAGGDKNSQVSIEHSIEIINVANAYKQSLKS